MMPTLGSVWTRDTKGATARGRKVKVREIFRDRVRIEYMDNGYPRWVNLSSFGAKGGYLPAEQTP